jgi:hypothetical protein
MQYLDKFDSLIDDNVGKYVTNPYIHLIIHAILIYYVMVYAQQLPPVAIRVLEHPAFKIVALFIILYFSKVNPSMALMLVIAFVVSMYVVNRYKLFANLMKFEGMNGAQQPYNPVEQGNSDGMVPQMLDGNSIALSCPGHYSYNYQNGLQTMVNGYDSNVVDNY